VVFKLDPSGTETPLYDFSGGADGANPHAGLIRDAVGNLYGTTSFGGNTSSSCPYGSTGCGVVFKLDPSGTETVLHTFSGGTDGANPYAGLIRDAAGNLYGTTSFGGNTSSSCPYGSTGCGVVFKLDPTGQHYRVLYPFSGGADGSAPEAGFVRDAAGNLYGTTGNGGSSCSVCIYGCGVVFKLVAAGNETVLSTFSGGADGSGPGPNRLIRDPSGNLYGTTSSGGNTSSSCPVGIYGGCGVVFKLDPSGKETVLYTFSGGADGWESLGGLIRDRAGNLYGTTGFGGNFSGSCNTYGCGMLFKLDPSGKETILHSLGGGTDGFFPEAGLLQYKGSLYGTAEGGGNYWSGVVFKLH
jgi:uncharacterized repeat protein (TIGR03803 family)